MADKDEIPKSDKIRENELWETIFATPAGKELADIWRKRLCTVKSFAPELSEAHCRYVSGRHSVYIDALKQIER